MVQLQYTFNKNDEDKMPKYAVTPIIKYLKQGAIIWCRFDTEDSQDVLTFREYGFNVIYGHIQTGQDFFNVEVPECDYIISNPPYSLKTEVFKHLREIGKPFAMLINFQGIFDNKERFGLFSNMPIEMMYLSPRVSYIKEGEYKTSGVPFQSGYLCRGILPKQIMFEKINKEK